MAELWSRLLDVTLLEQDIVPLTRKGVEAGNKVFGAAILRRSDQTLIVAGTNEETACPIWHGEMTTIRNLYALPQTARPSPEDCLFLSTHEAVLDVLVRHHVGRLPRHLLPLPLRADARSLSHPP